MTFDEREDIASLLQDIDEPKRRLKELKQYEILMEVLPNPVFVTDQSGYLTFVNQAFADLFGYDISIDDDIHVSEFLTDEDIDIFIELLREMITDHTKGTDPQTVELEGIIQDGRTRTFAVSVAPLSHDDEFVGATAVLRDITVRKRRKEVFTVMDRALRHNLRTNVNLITGYADSLKQELDEEHRAHLTRIRDAAEWIHKLGDSLRTLQTAIDEGFATDETVSVEQIVESVVESAQTIDSDADVSAHISAQGELEAGPPVEYALENVVENAIVHNDTDAPMVDIWVTYAFCDGWIDLHVEDNGPGIPTFERDIVLGDASIDQLQHGSGLGLWITRWVVEMFDGDLEIEDNDPRGSVVTLRLPMADSDNDPA